MSGLFNEEPTIAVRRQNIAPVGATQESPGSDIDLDGTERLIENLAIYGSPLLNAATELLGILVTLSRQGSPRDLERFRQQILDGIANFKRRGLYLDYHPSVIDKSCFVLCAAFDETIMYTDWGEKARWENHSLLSKVFTQRNGGEAFFVLLDKACLQPAKLVDFIELQYVLIMLGFKGRYRHIEESALHEVKSEVYTILRHYRTESQLPVPSSPKLKKAKQPGQLLSVNKILGLTLLFLIGGYGASEYWYQSRSEAVLSLYSSLDLSGVKIKTEDKDLVYLSVPTDIGEKPVEETAVAGTEGASPVPLKWEIFLALFTEPSDVLRLSNELKKAGYDTFSLETENGIELVLDAGNNLPAIKKLKNELNVRFGLNATIRRAQK